MGSTHIARSAFAQEVEDQRKNSPGCTHYEWLLLLLITILIFAYFLGAYFDPKNYTFNLKAAPPYDSRPVFVPDRIFWGILEGFHLVMALRILVAGTNTFNRKFEWQNTLKDFQSGQLFRLKLFALIRRLWVCPVA